MERQINSPREAECRILATDLDGTLIPLQGDRQNKEDLKTLAENVRRTDVTLVYITGRHFALATEAIEEFGLPRPNWLICDVGTSIFKQLPSGQFSPVEQYQEYQSQIVANLPIHVLRQRLETITAMRLQEPEKQGRFKLSFYTDATKLESLVGEIQRKLEQLSAPYSIVPSVDPFNGDGLIDLLPCTISKAHALAWWVEFAGSSREAIVFAGDSGNDLAALTAGYRSIVVGNADRAIAKKVYESHQESKWAHRLYLARNTATSGVLEGCRWFGLFEPVDADPERFGATPVNHAMTHFRVWAPQRRRVDVQLEHREERIRQPLTRHENGCFVGNVTGAAIDSRYRYVLDDKLERPDPESNFQPDGVHGPSRIVDHRAFPWTDQDWAGVPKGDLLIYELHIGAFTQEGTFRAAIDRIGELTGLGVTAIELMPVTQSPGRWNWGYDGVDLYSVRNTYGEPDDFKALIDACHAAGLAVILDVVYNHVGPEGNYLGDFGPYFSWKHHTPWGEAFNFDDVESRHVRRFIVENAIFWLETYHLDGLRLDAVGFIQDNSADTILDELRRAVTEFGQSAERTVHLIAESNVYDNTLLAEQDNRPAYDAIWCDCLMYSIYSHGLPDLRLVDRQYLGAGDLANSLKHGYVFTRPNQTRESFEADDERKFASRRRHIESFVAGLQTHDSVGNHPHGKRIHQLTSKAYQKAAAALTLLYPCIPLLFMGEDCAVESPFPFFVDFEDDQLRRAVDKGRAAAYPRSVWGDFPPPSSSNAFRRAKCHDKNHFDREMRGWYRQLIDLRKQGIAAGWLAIDRMSSSQRPNDVFLLQFQCDDGSHVSVHSRLSRTPRSVDVHIPVEGRILLSSRPEPRQTDGHVFLECNHAVIIKG